MKRPNIIQRIKAAFQPVPANINPLIRAANNQLIGFNNGVTIYPFGRDSTYIHQGYQKNAWVYSIVSKCAKKFSQVPWYHYKIKNTERKTWGEYLVLTKDRLSDPKAMIEAKKMRTKAVDQQIVDSPVTKLLRKPNNNQSGAAFMENLYGYKLLTGEGNIWFPRLDPGGKPTQMLIIPKQNLTLVKGVGAWDIEQYKIILIGYEKDTKKDDILMWKFPNYDFDPSMLTHLRGQAPLDAGLLLMQSSNEAAERLIAMNHNQGAAGLVYDKGLRDYPTQEQSSNMRRQFNMIVNDSDLAGQVAYLTGDLGYFQFGLDAGQLKLLEQTDVQYQGLCNIFDVPWQLFAGDPGTYENRKQYKRDFIYDNIAVAAYSLRDELNAKLIREFDLDRDNNVIDCDVMALPELSDDLKTQAETLSKLWQLTPNQVLEYIGYDRSTDPNMDKIYVPSGLQTMDQLNEDIGGGLEKDLNQLEG